MVMMMVMMMMMAFKVCEEFDKSRRVTNQNSISELLKQGWDANKILSESVVQLKKKDEESYELNIRPGETHMFDNNPFRDDVTEEEYRAANRAAKMKGRCDDQPKKPSARKVKDIKTPL